MAAPATLYPVVVGSGWPLTGRTEELQTITDSVATDGAPGIVLAGAAGVGKTRLAREALDRARRRGRLCRLVAATESARSVPLGAFAAYASDLGTDPLHRIREVVQTVTGEETCAPVVVVVDDAHLLDEQSALVVHQLVHRRLASVVLTIRTGEAAPDAITALWKDELLPRLEVQPLSKVETGSLLESVLAGSVESSTAERVWHYTRGNTLYLRQLVADELAAGRFTQRSGLWVWDTRLRVSQTLGELIGTTIGRQPDPVLAVLDVLAVADPLELDILSRIADPVAVNEAEISGLVTIDGEPDPPLARLAHPLFGEVRLAQAGTMRLRSLRSAVATGLGALGDRADPIRLIRRAMLLADSNTPPDPKLLIQAAWAAQQLMDPVVAERLARRAVDAGGGRTAQQVHALTLVSCDRIGDALAVNADMIEAAQTDHDRVLSTLGRAGMLMKNLAIDDAASLLEKIHGQVTETGLRRPYNCITAMLKVCQFRPQEAVDAATAGLTEPGWLPESFEGMGTLALVFGYGALGNLDAIRRHAEREYAHTRTGQPRSTSPNLPTQRFDIGNRHIDGLLLGGQVTEAERVVDRLAQEPMDFPFAIFHRASQYGMTAMARGNLASARRWLREAMATAASLETTVLRRYAESLLATILAMSGDPAGARAILCEKEGGRGLLHAAVAEAWACAAGGGVSEAITIVRDYAARAEATGCLAHEVWCLQTAAQFGDVTVAARLAELASIVQGPRATAAAKHAAALMDCNGDQLREAAALYEAFGDRIAAADAAAQAGVVYRNEGRRGAALTATAIASRLAAETGADTPALRAIATPIPFTERQREIVALAATGLSNREIADRLVMSVRTVEGHLFRASQKTGVNSREELIALLEGK